MDKIFIIVVVVLVGGFASSQARAQDSLKIPIVNAERQEVGQASLTDSPNGVIVGLSLREKPKGITSGVHALHIHAVGKCEPPFTSAGAHFNPQKVQHGFLAKTGGHAGDLPNIHVPERGELSVEFFVPNIRLKEGKTRLMDEDGSALVIHAQRDDYKTDPSGSAGDRIACGVIAAAKGK